MARRRARESIKRTPELPAAEAHDRAFLVRGAKRVPGSSTQIGDVGPPTGAPAAMPVTCQWLGAKQASFSKGQLKRMVVEMTAINRRKRSHGTIMTLTGGTRGSAPSVLTRVADSDWKGPNHKRQDSRACNRHVRLALHKLCKLFLRKRICPKCLPLRQPADASR